MKCPAENLPKKELTSVTFQTDFVGIVPVAKVRNHLCKNCHPLVFPWLSYAKQHKALYNLISRHLKENIA